MVKVDTAFEAMLISAERYACGRRTYVVGDTARYIISLKKELSDWCIGIILQDLADSFSRGETGDAIDYKEWVNVVRELTNEREKRANKKGKP